MEAPLVDPFQAPPTPNLSSEQLDAIQDMSRTEAWESASELLRWRQQWLHLHLLNAQENHALLQGMVKGFAMAVSLIENPYQAYEPVKETAGVPNERQLDFHEQWSKRGRSGHTGY